MRLSHGYYYRLLLFHPYLEDKAVLCCARLGSYLDLLLRPQAPFEGMLFPLHLAILCGVEMRLKNLRTPLCTHSLPLVGRLFAAHRAGTDFRGPFSRSLPLQSLQRWRKSLTVRQGHPHYILIASKQMEDGVTLAKSAFFPSFFILPLTG